ncbi:MAG TPA: glycerophosphodiester phosphodiesterase [Terriglobales bacterium]|jgi:glycerophosphoryl diester phosphodiesterase|nr:glycerophosphodiester phosphodiesterase [Terriglobales bacterium]
MTEPLLLGHRGARASRHIPENSLASFELCLQHGCDGFEFDVRLSRDGQAVICHDARFGGISIATATAESLALPTLEDVLRQFGSRAFLDIELKVGGLERRTVSALLAHPPRKGYVVSSFLPEVLAAVHSVDAAIPLGLLCESRSELRAWRETAAEWVIPHFKLVDEGLVEQVRGAGKKVMVWTVNRAARMREFAEWRMDAIISDETELMVRTLRNGQ